MAKVLDRKKDFGEIHGSGAARFEQGNVLFDFEGKEIVTDKKLTKAEEAKRLAEEAEQLAEETRLAEEAAQQLAASGDQQSLLDEQLAAQGEIGKS